MTDCTLCHDVLCELVLVWAAMAYGTNAQIEIKPFDDKEQSTTNFERRELDLSKSEYINYMDMSVKFSSSNSISEWRGTRQIFGQNTHLQLPTTEMQVNLFVGVFFSSHLFKCIPQRRYSELALSEIRIEFVNILYCFVKIQSKRFSVVLFSEYI